MAPLGDACRARARQRLIAGLAHDLVGTGDVAERAVARFAELPLGTFVWTRSSDGPFHLASAHPRRRRGATDRRAVG